MEHRFENISKFLIFKHLICLLDVSTWSTDHTFGDSKNNPYNYYLKTWKRVFTSEAVKNECGNLLHIFEILLIMPFTNPKLERMFSTMARVKLITGIG